MKGLILDTSLQTPFVILESQGTVLSSSFFFEGRTSTGFLSFINDFLKKQNCPFSDLSYIATSKGPGSFSGTRVAVTIASSLSYGLDIPLITFGSLSTFFIQNEGEFLCLGDAKSKGFYALAGTKEQGAITWGALSLVSSSELETLTQKNFYCLSKKELLSKNLSSSICLKETWVDQQRLSEECYEKFNASLFEKSKLPSIDIDYLRIS